MLDQGSNHIQLSQVNSRASRMERKKTNTTTPQKYKTYAVSLAKKMFTSVETLQRTSGLYKVIFIMSAALLLSTTIYSALHASSYFSTDSDAIVVTQQFSSGLQGHTVTLPGYHANLILIPFTYIQGHLQFNEASLAISIVVLYLITFITWTFLLIKLFGRNYEVLIMLLLASLVFTSVTFNINIGYDTLRNIEYPIALWFVLIINRLVKKSKYSRRQLLFTAVGTGLFCVVLAGDNLFDYGTLAPLILVIAWYWIQSCKFTAGMLKAVGLIAVVFIGAALIKLLLSASGVITFSYTLFGGSTAIIPTSNFFPSLSTALQQLLQLQGGFIFGETIHHNFDLFINFGVLIISLAGLVLILRQANRNFRAGKMFSDDNAFVFVTMAISFFLIFLVYILSGAVVTRQPNGQFISYLNARYISFLPLISVIGFIWLIKTYYKEHRLLLCLIAAGLLLGMGVSHSAVSATYKLDTQQEPTPSKASVENLITILKHNDVHEILTDYWYGPPIRFLSNDTISFAPEINCNQPLSFSTRKDWFTSLPSGKSALIIDRGGLNFGYWACTNQQLIQMYGNPIKKITVPGITSNAPVEVWVYDYDVRQHLLPLQK
jgi:hypothetical protein